MLQQQKIKLAIYGLILTLVLIISAFTAYYFQTQARDYRRLADLKLIQTAMSDYFLRNGTYLIPNCQANSMVRSCLPLSVSDPLNSGDYRYFITGLSETDYEVRFSLETGLGELQKGSHILTKNGVKR